MPSDMYYMRSQPERGFMAMLLDTARSTFEQLVATHGLEQEGLHLELVENYYQNVAAHITEYADANQVDLLIQGANGHSAFENFLYGSVTERLVEKYRDKPILIVR
jgi:nucleotide-binding universal stress UspA family protein